MTNTLDELERLLAKATAGPWEYDDGRTDGDERGKIPTIETRNPLLILAEMHGLFMEQDRPSVCPPLRVMDANADLIVALRNNAEKLLRVARAAAKVVRLDKPDRPARVWTELEAALKDLEGEA